MENNLSEKSLPELKAIATDLNIKYNPKIGAEKLIERISQQSPNRVETALKQNSVDVGEVKVTTNTIEDVEIAIKKHLDNPNFYADFKDDNTVIFKCKGAEDSVNLAVPLRVIKQKADMVASGARKIPYFKKSNSGVYSDDILYA